MSDREIFKISKEIAMELGVGKETRRLFLIGRPTFSLTILDRDEIRRSLKYVDEVLNHREHAQIPFALMMMQ